MSRQSSSPGVSLQAKLFATCWLIFVLHFATDIVREHYLSFSLAEDYSFRMDKYQGLHVDIVDVPGHGTHIDNNPGVSMFGAIPYWVFRPVIDRIVASINARRPPSAADDPVYDDPRPRRVEFYKKVYRRGLDIQFGLAALVIQAFFMAPLSALAAVVMLRTLTLAGLSVRMALFGAFLYALGTPVFFRTAFLNQNLFVAHLLLFGFVALWRPGGFPRWRDATACAFAGAMGGLALLSDYSGGVVLAWLGAYAVWTMWKSDRWRGGWRASLSYTCGAVGPIALLLFYQWRSFGSPFYPGQHYMPPVEGIEVGYKGVGGPEWRLFQMLLFDWRFGLFTSCPVLAFALVGCVQAIRRSTWLPRAEALFLAGFSLAFVVFFSAVQYTEVQWVTGFRYLAPVIPSLFLLAFLFLANLPRPVLYPIAVLTFAQSWCMSMVRATAIQDSLARVLLGGFHLPWMNVVSKMAPQYLTFLPQGQQLSPLPLFAICAVLMYGLWRDSGIPAARETERYTEQRTSR